LFINIYIYFPGTSQLRLGIELGISTGEVLHQRTMIEGYKTNQIDAKIARKVVLILRNFAKTIHDELEKK
jgi:hypothetical protein